MLFCYNADEKKKILSGAIVYVEFTCSLYVCQGFLQEFSFLPHPKDVHVR